MRTITVCDSVKSATWALARSAATATLGCKGGGAGRCLGGGLVVVVVIGLRELLLSGHPCIAVSGRPVDRA